MCEGRRQNVRTSELRHEAGRSARPRMSLRRVEAQLEKLQAVVVVVPEVVLKAGIEQTHCRAGASRERRVRSAEGDRKKVGRDVLEFRVLGSLELERRKRAHDLLGRDSSHTV